MRTNGGYMVKKAEKNLAKSAVADFSLIDENLLKSRIYTIRGVKVMLDADLAKKWNIDGKNPPINPPINDTQKSLLKLLQENNSYSYDELAALMKKHRDTIRENLKKLQELGLIRRVGARKNGHWEV